MAYTAHHIDAVTDQLLKSPVADSVEQEFVDMTFCAWVFCA